MSNILTFYKIKPANLILILFLTLTHFVMGQTTELEILSEATTFFKNGDYYSAANAYSKLIIDVKSPPIETTYKYAQSLRLSNAYREAAHWYLYVMNVDTNGRYPDAIYWFALMEKQNGNYDNAIPHFQKYLTLDNPGKLTEFAKIEIKSCEKAKWIIQDTLPVTIDHLGANINTPFSEFGAIQLSDSALYYSSLQRTVPDVEGSILPGVFVAKIFRAKMSIAGLSLPKEFDPMINDPGTYNANIAFNSDKSKLFFTRCTNCENKINCEIWVTFKKKNRWSKPEPLNRKINLQGTTNTQPCYLSGNEYDVLYFASNRPNGYGGMDIWYSMILNDKYSDPVNLGSNINTIGDEITPFYNPLDTTLYFSSNTHYGIGGFDIFSSKGGLNQWSQPKNMGVPINSSANDIYFTVNEIDNDGYLTSNRNGSFFIEGETCCNDIYYYEWAKNGQPIVSQDTLYLDTLNIEQLINNILPLTLYFHNDEPDPATNNIVTDKNYQTTLENYFALKNIYSDEYSKGLIGENAIIAKNEIDDLFSNYVKKGFTDLEMFAKWLLLDLERGNSVKITIKGYTSPLHTAEYNMKLAMRRISSLKNYIYHFRNGVFKPYLENGAPNGASLELHDAPFGKTQANTFVSDNPNDSRNSVYSRAAALERRIQIVMYESEKIEKKTDTLPSIALPTEEIKLDRLQKNEIKKITIQFQNRNDKPITIDSITTSNPSIQILFDHESVTKLSTSFITFVVKGTSENKSGTYYSDIYFNNGFSKRIKLTIN